MAMKKKTKTIIICICAVCIAIGVIDVLAGIQGKRLEKTEFTLPDGFTVTAHTGCMGTTQNSLESMRIGVQNASVIEFDVRFLEDGTPVLSHNKPNDDCIPLAQALGFVYENDIQANIDIKETTNLSRVQEIINFYNLKDKVFFTGVKEEYVEAVKKDSPEVRYFLNVNVNVLKNDNEKYIQTLIEKVRDSGAIGINFNYMGASRKLVEMFHENGLLVSVWTVNSKTDISRMLALSPDNITSKRPDKVNEIISSHR